MSVTLTSTLYVSGSVRRAGMFPRQRYGLGVMGMPNCCLDAIWIR